MQKVESTFFIIWHFSEGSMTLESFVGIPVADCVYLWQDCTLKIVGGALTYQRFIVAILCNNYKYQF